MVHSHLLHLTRYQHSSYRYILVIVLSQQTILQYRPYFHIYNNPNILYHKQPIQASKHVQTICDILCRHSDTGFVTGT